MSELTVARKAASAGAEVIRTFHANRGSFAIRHKGVHDIVTDADIAAEKEIIRVIREAFPNDNILSEETHNHTSIDSGRWWIIDPIDGTTNFAHGFPVFCPSVGYWENGKPHASCIIEVNSREEYYAEKGGGAFLNGEPMKVSDIKDPSHALVGTGFPYNDLTILGDTMDLFKHMMLNVQAVRRPGASTFDLASVACGRYDAYYEFALKAWDVGAGALLVQEAGGVVTNWNGGDDWLFAERVVAGNPWMHEYLLGKIMELVPAESRVKVTTKR